MSWLGGGHVKGTHVKKMHLFTYIKSQVERSEHSKLFFPESNVMLNYA